MKKVLFALMLGIISSPMYSQELECATKEIGTYEYEWESSMYSPRSSEPDGPSNEYVQNIIEGKYPYLKNLEQRKVLIAAVSTYKYRPSDQYRQKTITYFLTYEVPDHKKNMENGLTKALTKIKRGTIVSINQIVLPNGMDMDEYKERATDILMEKGYRVVAKEYLQKLYEEQKQQQSGIYNDQTTVQSNNFSAVGYYVNIKMTKEYMRVQIINVSTGEYDGTATIKFFNR